MANAGQWGVSPTMNVFENQTSTRATVVIVKCYENHATDARVKRIEVAPTGGVRRTDATQTTIR